MNHEIVSEEEWNRLQKEFNSQELELQGMSNQLASKRRDLPWMKISKDYTFTGLEGKLKLADLFQGRSQLFMQHFMFSPEETEGCRGCSFQADSVDGARAHFEPKDVAFVAVSRAPIEKLEKFRQRMGWKFKWVSSGESDFNYDFQVSFRPKEVASGRAFRDYEWQKVDLEDLPGQSVFIKNSHGEIFRTYSNYSGAEGILPALGYLDLTPIGRNQKEPLDWVKHHDRY